MKSQLERLIIARDELVRLNDKIYDLLSNEVPCTANKIEETMDTVSILMEEMIEGMIKS